MANIQMSVPLVFWGCRPPTHEITCICRSEDKKGIATASKSGQICLWDIYLDRETEKVRLRPRCLLFGGTSPTISLCFVRNWSGERDWIASLSSKGTVALWDGKDGACLKYVTILGPHNGIKSLTRSKFSETLIALYGKYSDIHILDSVTLDVICTLKASYNPNWNSEISFVSNSDRKDALLSLTVDGVAKVWLLPKGNEMKETEVIYEEKSKTLGISNPLSLSTYSYGKTGHSIYSIALVVCKDNWQLFDATSGKMKLLMIHACEPSVKSWMGGSLLNNRNAIIWAKDDGRAFLYKFSSHCVPGVPEDMEESTGSSTTGCSIKYVLGTDIGSSPAMYVDKYWHIQGDKKGRLYLWDMRRIQDEIPPYHSTDPIPHDTSSCIANSWEPPAMPCGLTDMLYEDGSIPTITCALYLSSFGRLVCGQADGTIAVLSATQAATVLMLQPKKFSRGWPQYCMLEGHKGKVNCLMYPYALSKAYQNEYLVSGGADFTVRLWDLYSGDLLHTFAVHGGEVKDIIPCPPNINPRLQTCVCSIAEDYSVAILSTSERKCLLVAASHSSPVESVRFRLEEDFLLVSCADGRLYVWLIETGSLDRCVDGDTAQIIFNNSPEVTNVATPPPFVPLQVRSVRPSEGDSLIQVLLFDTKGLVHRLSSMDLIVAEQPKKEKPQLQADAAFRTYLFARKHYGAGATTDSPNRPSPKRPNQPPLMRSASVSGPSELTMSSRDHERAREVLGRVVASQPKTEKLSEEDPMTIVNMARLLLSSLHAWNLDDSLDQSCQEVLGLVRPCRPVSFGLLSRGGGLSLVLPGWGLRSKPHLEAQQSVDFDAFMRKREDQPSTGPSTPSENGAAVAEKVSSRSVRKRLNSLGVPMTFDQKYHTRWQLSRSLTTQHLLTMVSITNTLMNQSAGAHALSRMSGTRRTSSMDEDSDESDSEDSHTMKDNQIRAVWSQVAALHCVMLPERMEGRFRAPHLPVLASRFLDTSNAIREASQALLQAELRRIGSEGRQALVAYYAQYLQSPASFKTPAEREKTKHFAEDPEKSITLESSSPIPTQQQQSTALIILGMIGAEFSAVGKPKIRKKSTSGKSATDFEPMDTAIARQTAKTLQAVLLEQPATKSALHSYLRCSAAELLGRGFNLWEKYVDVAQVVMGLLDLAIQYSPALAAAGNEEDKAKKNPSKHNAIKSTKFASEVARKALNLMILLHPVTMVTTLGKEVATFLVSQHIYHFPNSSIQPAQVGVVPPPSTAGIVTPANALLSAARGEILDLMKTSIEKCSQQISLEMLNVIDIVIFCLDLEHLKKKNLLEIFPSLSKIPNVSYSFKIKRLAVGARSGQVGIYDFKQGKTQVFTAHSHAVTVLLFSDDGKMLATYAYGDSTLSVWQVSSSFLFGGMMNLTPKFVNSWPAISSSSPGPYLSYIRLEWCGSRSIILHMPGGVECKYSL